MLDIQFIREHPDIVAKKAKQKGYKVNIPRLLITDEKRRKLLADQEAIKQKRNKLAATSKGTKPNQKQIQEGKLLKEQDAQLHKQLEQVELDYKKLLLQVPNMPLDDVPIGSSEADNVVMKNVGVKPHFDFAHKNHVEIGTAKGWIDKERAAKVAGSRFVYLKGDLVRLEFALWQYALDALTDQKRLEDIIVKNNLRVSSKPFVPVLPPAVARTDVYEATGRLDKEQQTYKLASDDLWLNASAEHTMAPMHMNETLEFDELPLRYVGYTTAFRREAGTYGKDTDGIIRLHQFNKLEMESFTQAQDSLNEHLFLVAIQEYLMQQLDIPYRVLRKCTADIGGPNASGIDIDAWMPGQNAYRETHTADLITDFQARRLKTKARRKDGLLEFVHTNDATVFSERPLIAIIENNQTKDGDVKVPKVLRPYMGGKEII